MAQNEIPVSEEPLDFNLNFLYGSDDSEDESEDDSEDSSDDALHRDLREKSATNSLFNVDCTSDEFDATKLSPDVLKTVRFLRHWALTDNVSHSTLSKLCKGLKTVHPQCFAGLPTDARTILKTPRISNLNITTVPPGEYFHVGLKVQINLALSLLSQPVSYIYTLFNVDGLPLFKSSKGELWPILMEVKSSPQLKNKVFPIGIYFGDGKPHDLNLFLTPFLNELMDVLQNGIIFDHRKILVQLLGFCCDAPAKAFILGTIAHTGFSSCTRCTVTGETFENRRIFPKLNCAPRTDADFRNRSDPHYQPVDRSTPLIALPQLDFVKSFILDYMHLICLGVVRTILSLWAFGPRPFLLPIQTRMTLSEALVNLKTYMPSEFVRKPRELNSLPRWKATELRSFVLYLAPIVLKQSLLPRRQYFHFVSLHVAMTLLLNSRFCASQSNRQYARELLIHFVSITPELYSPKLLTHNFHNLVHLVDDADHFSCFIDDFNLNDISSFPFENFLQIFKKLVRGKAKPLQQISRRIIELFSLGHIKDMYLQPLSHTFPCFKTPHHDGPLLPCCREPQFKTITFQHFKISVNSADDCCCVQNGDVIVVENIAFSETLSADVIIGRKYLHKTDFFSEPLCPSSDLNIFKVKNLSDREMWRVADITFKFVRLPFEEEFVVFPLLHTDG
ncbi:hypothetical protein PPYR_01535 [Photinus pyralis]|uniref:Transposase domain-containing protein n=1 Tax=Photinus pyralis TaxID=7054 RepID=A0A5N4B4P0_PHOPY|nr:hypothetical protein PPYR_01535 [Photinus pyralis]